MKPQLSRMQSNKIPNMDQQARGSIFMTPVTPQGVCVFLSDYNRIG